MRFAYYVCVLMCSGVLSIPVDNRESQKGLHRDVRSLDLIKKKLHILLGGGIGGYEGAGGHGGGGTYITNINNYGPPGNYGHHSGNNGHGGNVVSAVAFAGGHGSSQNQAAAFSAGPHSASFAQSQAHGGGKGKDFNYYDY